jgi:hypothetical protein
VKKKFFNAALILSVLVLIEAGLSVFFLYRYRYHGVVRDGRSLFSTAVAVEKILTGPPHDHWRQYRFLKESIPEPFFQEDEWLGYSAVPGTYAHFYKRRLRTNLEQAPWEQMEIRVRINPDGSRWTGRERKPGLPDIYVLGDSHVFGSGVNDEQTFSYHLQMADDQANVRLFALSGYGLGQAYRRVELLKNEIKSTDILVIGYADFYDQRSVAAPSWLKQRHQVQGEVVYFRPRGKALKADLTKSGEVRFSLIEEVCSKNAGYCDQPDPSQESMAKVSAALINGIARMTPAKVYVLYFQGRGNSRIFEELDEKIEVIRALPGDFNSFIQDNVEGFDTHPGPYWHYAIFRRLIEALDPAGKGAI